MDQRRKLFVLGSIGTSAPYLKKNRRDPSSERDITLLWITSPGKLQGNTAGFGRPDKAGRGSHKAVAPLINRNPVA